MNLTDVEVPCNPEAEAAALSCGLQGSMGHLVQHGTSDEDFHDLRNRAIWTTMKGLFDSNEEVTMESVGIELSKNGLLEQVGSLAYLNQVMDSASSPHQLPYFLKVIQEYSKKRQLQALAIGTISSLSEPSSNIDQLIESTVESVTHLARGSGENNKSTRDYLYELVDDVERCATSGVSDGVKSNYPPVRKYFPVFDDTSFTIIAARPSNGKTSMALDLADHMQQAGAKVKFYSMEMPVKQMLRKYMLHHNGTKVDWMEQGVFDSSDLSRMGAAVKYISESSIEFIEAPSLSPSKVAADVACWKAQSQVDVVFIDYIQLMNGPKEYIGNRTSELTAITRMLKQVALRYHVPIIAMAQINRESEREVRRPRKSDLRESGSLEQDANNIILIHLPDPTNIDDNYATPAEIIIEKNRMGPAPAILKGVFVKARSKFMTYEAYNRFTGGSGSSDTEDTGVANGVPLVA